MTRRALCFGAALLGLALTAAADDDRVGMDSWFLSDAAAGAGWEGVRERSPDPTLDADMRGWGVRAQGARHYTRKGAEGVEVCSVEIWAFASEAQARNAAETLEHPGWRFDHRGHLLIMLRGLRWAADGTSRNGLYPACTALGERSSAKVAALLGR